MSVKFSTGCWRTGCTSKRRNVSSTYAPRHSWVTSLLRGRYGWIPLRPFSWTPEADRAFRDLKERFTSAPILTQPDPARQFVVEVDASDVGVGAVLSQRSSEDGKLHPCAFLSRRLSPAETNYDVGNRELLAVVVALGEWCHWLEGAEQPFVVWT
ncbi:hypothetical protein UPYG_G00022990, partial [Umbra pygmaea]